MSAQARREQFVEAAIKVMSREGMDRATTRRIAAEAGAPHGAFHYAFRGKNELLTGVVPEEGPAKGSRGAAAAGQRAAVTNAPREPGGAAP